MASKLPSSLLEEYENNIRGETAETFTSGGQTIHTVLPVTLPLLHHYKE